MASVLTYLMDMLGPYLTPLKHWHCRLLIPAWNCFFCFRDTGLSKFLALIWLFLLSLSLVLLLSPKILLCPRVPLSSEHLHFYVFYGQTCSNLWPLYFLYPNPRLPSSLACQSLTHSLLCKSLCILGSVWLLSLTSPPGPEVPVRSTLAHVWRVRYGPSCHLCTALQAMISLFTTGQLK